MKTRMNLFKEKLRSLLPRPLPSPLLVRVLVKPPVSCALPDIVKSSLDDVAADAFLANLDMSALDDAEGLGLIDDDNIKLDDHDLNDTGR